MLLFKVYPANLKFSQELFESLVKDQLLSALFFHNSPDEGVSGKGYFRPLYKLTWVPRSPKPFFL